MNLVKTIIRSGFGFILGFAGLWLMGAALMLSAAIVVKACFS